MQIEQRRPLHVHVVRTEPTIYFFADASAWMFAGKRSVDSLPCASIPFTNLV